MKIKNFNENFDKIIPIVSSVIALIIGVIFLFVNINIFYSFILCFLVSLAIFIKNLVILSNVLYRRLEPAKLWITVNVISSSVLYLAVITIVVLLEPFHLIGLVGLLIISTVTKILGIIVK